MADQDGAQAPSPGDDLRKRIAGLERRIFDLEGLLRLREEDLQASEQRYLRLTQAVTDFVYTVRLEGGRVAAAQYGPGCVSVTGYATKDFEADPSLWSRIILAEDLPAVDEQARRMLAGVASDPFEYRITHRDGRVRWVRNAPVLHFDPAGRLVSIDGLVQDITDRVRSQERQERLQEQLAHVQKMEAVGRLAGGIAHEFNNLLMGILAYSELAMLAVDKASSAAQDLIDIKAIVQRAKTLTQEILTFSRTQSAATAAVDLNAEIATVDKMLRRLIGEHIAIVTHLDPDLGLVQANSSQLQQVLVNLALNARDAMRGGGTLTLTTASVTLDEDAARALPGLTPGEHVLLTVADTGTGIEPATLSHIFEPFFSTKELGHGAGLGLATSYGLIKQHGGHIDVESAPGAGATFRIYLPRVAQAQATDDGAHKPAAIVGGGETILVVEDEALVRGPACRYLTGCGYQVLSAAGPREALDTARHHGGPIHLLLTDLALPDMNGRELYARLSPDHPETRVLYMSGYIGDASDGTPLEERHFLQKPFGVAELAHKLRQLLDPQDTEPPLGQ